MISSGHRVRESTSVSRAAEFTVTVHGYAVGGAGHAQARASRDLQGALAGAAEDLDDARLRTLDAAGVLERSQLY